MSATQELASIDELEAVETDHVVEFIADSHSTDAVKLLLNLIELRGKLQQTIVILCGPSGVGKSSFINHCNKLLLLTS